MFSLFSLIRQNFLAIFADKKYLILLQFIFILCCFFFLLVNVCWDDLTRHVLAQKKFIIFGLVNALLLSMLLLSLIFNT